MTRQIRPTLAFVLRLWREPGTQEGEDGWRGLIRPLATNGLSAGEEEVPFLGLGSLLEALRPLLEVKEPLEPS